MRNSPKLQSFKAAFILRSIRQIDFAVQHQINPATLSKYLNGFIEMPEKIEQLLARELGIESQIRAINAREKRGI